MSEQRVKSRTKAIEDNAPWLPPKYDIPDVAAIQALSRGDATPEMQQRALKWIIESACGTYDFPYRPAPNDRDTNIALGRMFVGQQIVKMLKLNLEFLRRKQ